MSNATLVAANAARWEKAKITRPNDFSAVARSLVANKPRYQAVAAKTGVPWFVIAVIHQRESSGSFAGVLHNGEKIIGTKVKTEKVPKGRGPFISWEEAAVDALTNCGPYAASNKDWSVGGTLTLLERYNGLGYANRGLPSPYIWSGTDQYVKGKYVKDNVFDPNHVDMQLGCAGLIKAMQAIDPSVRFGNAAGGLAAGIGAGGAVVATGVAQAGAPPWAVALLAIGLVALVAFIVIRARK
ncbi:MAG TPA: hypothetical protein VNZ94_00535 [Xanthobacteraceae bacterium]|nr:hypothetical protein [Xanthobacteraceae bacterium]